MEILGDGKQKKPYLYVTDCVQGILHGYTHSHDTINVFNLGCDTATDVTTIADYVTNAMNLTNVTYTYTGGTRGWKGDVPQFQFDITKITNLGWTPNYTSDQAVKKAIQDIQSTQFGGGATTPSVNTAGGVPSTGAGLVPGTTSQGGFLALAPPTTTALNFWAPAYASNAA